MTPRTRSDSRLTNDPEHRGRSVFGTLPRRRPDPSAREHSPGARATGGSPRTTARAQAAKPREAAPRPRAFVWVREEALLGETLVRLSDYFEYTRRRHPGAPAPVLLGVWIGNASSGPAPWSPPGLPNGEVHIAQTSGLPGAWTLCLIEGELTSEQLERACRRADGDTAVGRFLRVEERAADDRAARPLGTLVQDPATGRLAISA